MASEGEGIEIHDQNEKSASRQRRIQEGHP